MFKKSPANRYFAAYILSILFITQASCILLEEPPPTPDFAARAAQAADAGLADAGDMRDIGSADTDDELPPGTCNTEADCQDWPANHNFTAVCTNGTCKYKCRGTFKDCDEKWELNGCEADLARDLDNCGSCGTICVPNEANHQPICEPADEGDSPAYKCDVEVGTCATGYIKNSDNKCVCDTNAANNNCIFEDGG